MSDGGGEFDAEMQLGLDRDGTLVDKTTAYAPWQNAIAERGGGRRSARLNLEIEKKLMN